MTRDISDQDHFSHPHSVRKKGIAAMGLKCLSSGKHRLTIDRIGYDLDDPYLHNLEVGSPDRSKP
ncbi:MAG: hypothetical protein WB679_11985 [Terracidiphilus sp.]